MSLRSVSFIRGKQNHYNSFKNKKRFYSGPCRYLFMLFFLSNVLGSNLAFAQWSADPGINTAVSRTGSLTGGPSIIPGENGSVIIVWSDSRDGSNNYNIFAQQLNASGQPQWTTDGLAICSAPGDQTNPYVVSDGSGGAIIAWSDQRDGIDADIYAQHVSSSGQLTWATNGIPVCNADKGQGLTSMIADGNGGAVIGWHDYRNEAFTNIYVQHLNASGTMKWTANGLAVCPQPNFQHFPTLLLNSAGNTIITWEDSRNAFTSIYAQMIGPDGNIKWSTGGVPVCAADHKNFLPTILPDGEQGAIIAWLDYRRSDRSDIYAQRINKDGVTRWQTNGVEIGRATGWQRGPQMASNNAGGAIITWDDYRLGGNATTNTYAQRVNKDGIIEWAEYGVAVCSTATRQYWSSIASDGAGGAIITWKDNRYGNTGDIYAQHLNASGISSWDKNGVIISSAHNGQAFPTIVSIEKRGAVIAWVDSRNGGDPGNGIYAQNVNLNGKIGCFTPVITKQPLAAQTIWQGATAASLMVAVTGDQLKYQWYSNTTASTTDAVNLHPSGTEASFTPSASKEGTVYYYCRVTSNCDTVYSDFAQVTVNIPITKLEVKISPNPTESFFIVTIKNPDDGIIYIRLFDMLGRLVEYQQGPTSQSFKLAEKLAAGMYLIEVRQGDEVVVTKAVKQ